MSVVSADGYPSAEAFGREGTELRLSRAELIEAAGIDAESFNKLEEFGLVAPSPVAGTSTGMHSSSRRPSPRWPVTGSRPATCAP